MSILIPVGKRGWHVTRLSNLQVKALTSFFLLTKICLPRSLRRRLTRVFHTCIPFFSYQFQPGWNLRTCIVSTPIISDLPYPYPFAARPVSKLKARGSAAEHSPGKAIRAISPNCNHFSLGHAHQSQEWSYAPGVKWESKSQCTA